MARPTKPEGAGIQPYAYLSDSDKSAVVEALRTCATVSAAIRAAGLQDRASTVYAAIRADPLGFGAEIEHAQEAYRNSIRAEIYRRGVLGVDKPLSYQGCLTGFTEKQYSDEMLKAAARLALPEFVDKKSIGELAVHGDLTVHDQPAGMWSISDSEARALPDSLKVQLANVLKHLIRERRAVTRQQNTFAALTDQTETVDAEFSEVADPFDMAELATVF